MRELVLALEAPVALGTLERAGVTVGVALRAGESASDAVTRTSEHHTRMMVGLSCSKSARAYPVLPVRALGDAVDAARAVQAALTPLVSGEPGLVHGQLAVSTGPRHGDLQQLERPKHDVFCFFFVRGHGQINKLC